MNKNKKISVSLRRYHKQKKRSLRIRIVMAQIFVLSGLLVAGYAMACRIQTDKIINDTIRVEAIQCSNGKFSTDCSLIDTERDGKTAKVEKQTLLARPPVGDEEVLIPSSLATGIEEQIRQIAKEENFKWEDYLVRLAYHESRFNPYATNLNKGYSLDAGVFQINQKYHPEVGLKCSFDVKCATLWTIKQINAGNQHWWVANKKAIAGW